MVNENCFSEAQNSAKRFGNVEKGNLKEQTRRLHARDFKTDEEQKSPSHFEVNHILGLKDLKLILSDSDNKEGVQELFIDGSQVGSNDAVSSSMETEENNDHPMDQGQEGCVPPPTEEKQIIPTEVPEEEPTDSICTCTSMTISKTTVDDSSGTDDNTNDVSPPSDPVNSPHHVTNLFSWWSLDSGETIYDMEWFNHCSSYNDEGGGTKVPFDASDAWFNIYTDEEYAALEDDALNEVPAITNPVQEQEGREIHKGRIKHKLYKKAVKAISLPHKPKKIIRYRASSAQGSYHYSNGKAIRPNTAETGGQYNNYISINGHEAGTSPFQSHHNTNSNNNDENNSASPNGLTDSQSQRQNESLLACAVIVEKSTDDKKTLIPDNRGCEQEETNVGSKKPYIKDKAQIIPKHSIDSNPHSQYKPLFARNVCEYYFKHIREIMESQEDELSYLVTPHTAFKIRLIEEFEPGLQLSVLQEKDCEMSRGFLYTCVPSSKEV